MIPTTTDTKYKYQELKSCLIDRIRNGVYHDGKKISSEPELCREFSLSRNTIRQAVKELEQAGFLYRVQGKGTFVRNRTPEQSRKIALIIYDVSYATHPLTVGLIRGLDAVLSENGYLLDILASHRNFQDENFAQLAAHYAGFLIGAYQIDPLILQELRRLEVPLLFVKNYQPDCLNDAIRIDFHRAGYLAAEHLIKLGRGELALVYGGDQAAISREYRAGVVDCCLEYGARLRGSHIYEVDFLNSSGALPAIADRLADSPSRPDGLLAIDDQIAAELIRLLQARNRRVPQDIAVVGCNNSEIASLNSPSITTIEIPTFALGQLAAREIISRIGGTAENHAPLEVKLLAGESTAVAAK